MFGPTADGANGDRTATLTRTSTAAGRLLGPDETWKSHAPSRAHHPTQLCAAATRRRADASGRGDRRVLRRRLAGAGRRGRLGRAPGPPQRVRLRTGNRRLRPAGPVARPPVEAAGVRATRRRCRGAPASARGPELPGRGRRACRRRPRRGAGPRRAAAVRRPAVARAGRDRLDARAGGARGIVAGPAPARTVLPRLAHPARRPRGHGDGAGDRARDRLEAPPRRRCDPAH